MGCMTCGQNQGSKKSGSGSKKTSGISASSQKLPKGWSTGSSAFGKPSVKMSFSGRGR